MALQQARQQGLLGLAAGLLQAGGPSRTRTNIGQAVGSGLMAGQQMYQQALDRQLQGQLTMEKVGEARRQREQQAMARQLLPQLVTTERQQALTTGAQAADPLASLIQSAEAGTLNQPVINQVAANTLRSLLPPADFAKVMDAIKTQIDVGQAKKPELREVGGTLYSVSGTTATPIVSAGTTPKLSDLGSLYAAVNFPGVATKDLKPDQLGQILEFQQRPSPASLTDLQIKANQLFAETGIDLRPNVSALGGGRPQAAAPAAEQPVAQAAQVAQAPAAQPVEQAPAEQQFVPAVNNPAIPLKFQTELKVAQPKVVTATRGAIKDLRDLRDAVEEVRNHPGLRTATGFGGVALSAIPGTEAANAAALLDNLKNRNFIAGIVNLRQQSPTGSGVGSLTEREGARFENLKASLSQAQTIDQLRDQLDALSRATDEAISGLYEGYQLDYGKNRTIEEDLKKSVVRRPGQQKSLDEIFKRR